MSADMSNYTFQTKTGLLIRVRQIVPEDAAYLVDIFKHMSSESRYQRFHQAVDHVSSERVWNEAEHIVQADPTTGRGLLAFADLPDQPDAPVAAARYVELEPGTAEVAMSVRDDLQNMHIGTNLLQLLAKEAQAAGIGKLVGTIQNNNEAIWRVLQHLPFPVDRKPEGTYSTIEVDLTALKTETVLADDADETVEVP